jgi:hypothetical protein
VKFRDYVHLRGSGRGAHHRGVATLRAYDLPDVFESWPALRDWLRANGAPPSDIGVSRPVWMAYRRCLEFNGISMPQKAPEPPVRLPSAAQTVMDAPVLGHLSELGHQTRKVGQQTGPRTWQWFGDLTDPTEFQIYRKMRDADMLIQLSYRPDTPQRYPILFARISTNVDPVSAYRTASQRVRQERQAEERALRIRHSYGSRRHG